MVTSEEIDEDCRKKGFLFFTSHTNDPLVAAVGGKTLEIVVRDDLALKARERGRQLMDGLRRLQERYGCIADVRGWGLLIGLEILDDHDGSDAAIRLSEALWRRGLWCQLTNKAVFRVGPAINSTSEEIHDGLRILEEALSEVDKQCYAFQT